VLLVVAVLTLAAYYFGDMMLDETKAADSSLRLLQARCFAESGIDYAAGLLSNPATFAGVLNSNPFNNPTAFQGVMVSPADHPRFQGRFSICAPLDPNESANDGLPFRYGVSDESAKININALLQIDKTGNTARAMLMALPNMTEAIADAIIDWIDADDKARANGAEDSYYTAVQPPYHCKNGPLDSLEELLLVRGVTADLLFGNDANRNGVLDPGEGDNSGAFNPGWSAYLTIYSREQNVATDNVPRIYVNSVDVQKMYDKLKPAVGDDMAYYIAAYRLYGPAQDPGSPGSAAGAPGKSGTAAAAGTTSGNSSSIDAQDNTTQDSSSKNSADKKKQDDEARDASKQERTDLDFTRKPVASIDSLYDLLTGKVDVTTKQGKRVRYISPLSDSGTRRVTFPKVLDRTTTTSDSDLPARINVNTASAVVLSALPGIQVAEIQKILAYQPSRRTSDAPDPIFSTPAWLLFKAGLQPSRVKAWEKYITARSQVYRVSAIGWFQSGGPMVRIEAIIDTNGGRPRIVYWRDLTELGIGFNVAAQ
jgi:type II secretory pathway component PulK